MPREPQPVNFSQLRAARLKKIKDRARVKPVDTEALKRRIEFILRTTSPKNEKNFFEWLAKIQSKEARKKAMLKAMRSYDIFGLKNSRLEVVAEKRAKVMDETTIYLFAAKRILENARRTPTSKSVEETKKCQELAFGALKRLEKIMGEYAHPYISDVMNELNRLKEK